MSLGRGGRAIVRGASRVAQKHAKAARPVFFSAEVLSRDLISNAVIVDIAESGTATTVKIAGQTMPEVGDFITVQMNGDEAILALSTGGVVAASGADLAGYQPTSEKGNPDGYASLDGTGKVPASQLPVASSAIYPRHVPVDIFAPASHINWDTNVQASVIHGGYKETTNTLVGNWIEWELVLGAGTWRVDLMHRQRVLNGIYTVMFDGVSKGTIDGYAAANTPNVRSNLTGIAVAATALVTVRLEILTKNGAATGFGGQIQSLTLRRTA